MGARWWQWLRTSDITITGRLLRKTLKDALRAVEVSPQRQPPAWRWAHRCYLLPTTRGVHGGGEGALRIGPTRRRCGAGDALQCLLAWRSNSASSRA
jgi:hypothetical protein